MSKAYVSASQTMHLNIWMQLMSAFDDKVLGIEAGVLPRGKYHYVRDGRHWLGLAELPNGVIIASHSATAGSGMPIWTDAYMKSRFGADGLRDLLSGHMPGLGPRSLPRRLPRRA